MHPVKESFVPPAKHSDALAVKPRAASSRYLPAFRSSPAC